METVVRARITCNIVELQNGAPFARAMMFTAFNSEVDIHCVDNGCTAHYVFSPMDAHRIVWAQLREEWERQCGRLPSLW